MNIPVTVMVFLNIIETCSRKIIAVAKRKVFFVSRRNIINRKIMNVSIYFYTYMFLYSSINMYVCTYIVFPHTDMISKGRNEVRRGPSPTSKHIHNICLKQEPDVMRRTSI